METFVLHVLLATGVLLIPTACSTVPEEPVYRPDVCHYHREYVGNDIIFRYVCHPGGPELKKSPTPNWE